MVKQRLSKSSRKSRPASTTGRSLRKPASFWRRRLFKSVFTRNGRSVAVRGWAIRIQYQGRRRTFSLGAISQSEAASKAGQIYQTIQIKGWDVAAQLYARRSSSSQQQGEDAKSTLVPKTALRYWKLRLLRRKHPGQSHPRQTDEFSVRIEHEGISHYFPLGTLDENAAAAKALGVYRTVVSRGWDAANQQFSRELTLGFHWVANPVAWTYTTIHTSLGESELQSGGGTNTSSWLIAIVESDTGTRRAVAASLHRPEAALGTFTCASGTEALREIPNRSVQLVLCNHSLTDMPGDLLLEKLGVLAPQLPGLIYSVYEDSDQLFKATPGGAAGYLLKRTVPEQMLEPIAPLLAKPPLASQAILQHVRQYFQNVTTLLQSGEPLHEMGKLTPREKEILNHLSKGYLDKEIAYTLGISVWTVHGHLKNIFEKLQVHSRTEAVVKFLQK